MKVIELMKLLKGLNPEADVLFIDENALMDIEFVYAKSDNTGVVFAQELEDLRWVINPPM